MRPGTGDLAFPSSASGITPVALSSAVAPSVVGPGRASSRLEPAAWHPLVAADSELLLPPTAHEPPAAAPASVAAEVPSSAPPPPPAPAPAPRPPPAPAAGAAGGVAPPLPCPTLRALPASRWRLARSALCSRWSWSLIAVSDSAHTALGSPSALPAAELAGGSMDGGGTMTSPTEAVEFSPSRESAATMAAGRPSAMAPVVAHTSKAGAPRRAGAAAGSEGASCGGGGLAAASSASSGSISAVTMASAPGLSLGLAERCHTCSSSQEGCVGSSPLQEAAWTIMFPPLSQATAEAALRLGPQSEAGGADALALVRAGWSAHASETTPSCGAEPAASPASCCFAALPSPTKR
mmetsp:Transcript_873/g.3386  ORF Transcript_873/g.3386 Transcript_873/m.3386 type:complete len:351 (-) Transcript_873:2315-3367(-)